jgi:hypothetical protein
MNAVRPCVAYSKRVVNYRMTPYCELLLILKESWWGVDGETWLDVFGMTSIRLT